MYTEPLLTALKRTFPAKRFWHVLEGNDPTGFKSGKCNAAKEEMNVKPIPMPKRSPNLSVCVLMRFGRQLTARRVPWSGVCC